MHKTDLYLSLCCCVICLLFLLVLLKLSIYSVNLYSSVYSTSQKYMSCGLCVLFLRDGLCMSIIRDGDGNVCVVCRGGTVHVFVRYGRHGSAREIARRIHSIKINKTRVQIN